jgi:DNA-binding protein H-NS
MAKQNLASMSVDALLKLRDDIGAVLSQKVNQLQGQLARLGGDMTGGGRGRRGASPLKGRKAAVKYRDKTGNHWSGRGAQPRWLTAAIKDGAKREDFLVDKSAVKKSAPRKKRRKRKKVAARKQGQVRNARKKKSRTIARKKRQAPARKKQRASKAIARKTRQKRETKIQKQVVPTANNQTVEVSEQRSDSPTE